MRSTVAGEQSLCRVALESGNSQEQMLGRNVLVFECVSLFECPVEKLIELRRHRRLRGSA